jgi:hypothetical protein
MSSKIQHLLAAAAGLALVGIAVPASAQETVRIRGTIERIEGPVYVVKSRDGSELKLTVTDNPLYVAIVPGTMADIKPGMFVGSAGMMQPDGTQRPSRSISSRNRCAAPARAITTGILSRRAR